MRQRFFRWLRRKLIFLLLCYLGVCAGMWILENRFVFPAQRASDFWQEPPSSEIEEITFDDETNNTIHAWFLPCPESKTALLLCHGNGGNLSSRGGTMLRLREQFNCSVLIFDYPGYGKSTGRPTETGCYSSGRAAMNWLGESRGIRGENLLLYGESLGGGVAVELALTHPVRAVILVKTFTSLPAVAKRKFPWLPVYTLMRNRFDSLSKIDRLTSPVFIASATNDEIVPFKHGQELFAKTPGMKSFLALEGQGHNDKLPDEFFDAVKRFLDAIP